MNLGLVFEQGDGVLIAVFLALVLMSIITWAVIVLRGLKLWQAKRGNRQAHELIWNAADVDQAAAQARIVTSPISDLTLAAVDAQQQYRRAHGQQLAAAVPLNDYLVRQIRNSMTQILRRFDGGLTALASIGATAPFIGLFGTVWGIYHALINISHSGQMSIAAVAGPSAKPWWPPPLGCLWPFPPCWPTTPLCAATKPWHKTWTTSPTICTCNCSTIRTKPWPLAQ